MSEYVVNGLDFPANAHLRSFRMSEYVVNGLGLTKINFIKKLEKSTMTLVLI